MSVLCLMHVNICATEKKVKHFYSSQLAVNYSQDSSLPVHLVNFCHTISTLMV